jgi:DNA-binding response OmpR family regulator
MGDALKGEALIVEDEAVAGELLAEFVRRKGYEPTVFDAGEPVCDWVREHRPELILLDLMLPDIDGFSLCERLKLERDTNLIPIIMITALDERQHRIRGFKVGANFYLTKPYTCDQLYLAMDEAVNWRRAVLEHGTTGEVHFHLQSDTSYLDELNKLLSSLFHFSGLEETHVKQLTLAVRELGANAIEWGHRRQVDLLVTVTYRIDREKITIVIKDTGPGFNPRQLPHAAQPDDPVGHMEVRESLGLREGGFGIMIANGLVDELHYNECGNEARLVKYFAPGCAAKK